jgi:predicted alpha/beta hydrolase family esterase
MGKVKFFLLTKSLGLSVNLLSLVAPKKSRAFAYKLFSEPRFGQLEAATLPGILNDSEKETIIHDGNVIQTYSWKGNGPTILLVHGWESNAARWDRLLPYLLDSGNSVIAMDAPSHGLSGGKFSIPVYADFINEVAKKFGPDYIIGHSIGGSACIFYQHTYQNPKLKKLVIMGAPADFNTITGNYAKLLTLSPKSKRLFESHFTKHFHFHPDDFTARHFAKSLKVKGIIAHDNDDDVVLFEEAVKIASVWTEATLIETKGLGHSMHDDALYGKIAEFLISGLAN